MKNSNEADVSQQFFQLCSELNEGELVYTDEFKLQDAMASVELMDLKMDIGIRRLPKGMGVEKAISEGLYEDDLKKQIATIDATLAMLVSWLEGNSLLQTVWTNVMLSECDKVTDEVYSTFCNGIIHIVQLISCVVQTSCTYEEEDFNVHVPFSISSKVPRERVISELRRLVLSTSARAEKTIGDNTRKEHLLALSTRLEFTFLFIEIIMELTPPPKAEEKRQHADDENSDEDEMESVEEEEEKPQVQFQPLFGKALATSRTLTGCCEAIYGTIGMGTESPEGGDGDFRWLPAFEPDLNRKFLPSTFPRKVIIPDRKKAMYWFVQMARRFDRIASFAESSVLELTSLFYFARSFNFNKSCVLTRSVLQLAMFPVDEHIFGDPKHTIAEPIETSLKEMFSPLVLERAFPVYHDLMAQRLYNRFLTQMSRVALTVYQLFGCNMARQRDRLVHVMKDFNSIQEFANHVERRTDQVMIEKNVSEISDAPHHSVSTFVFYNLLALVSHYFELSLRMDLFVPYEFTYVYWYLGDILSRWQISTLERAQDMMMQGWKQNPLSSNVNPRKTRERAKAEDCLRKRLQMNQYQMVQQFALGQMCDGIVKITIVMIKLKKIKVPSWADDSEKLRYDNRMNPLEMLGNPLYINYEQYRNLSRIDEDYKTSNHELIDSAMEHFDSARTSLIQLSERAEVTEDCMLHLRVAKSNWIAAKLMKTQDLSNRKVEWFFSDDCPIYPQIKIT